MKLQTAKLVSSYVQGNKYVVNLTTKDSENILIKAQLQYELVSVLSTIYVQCTIHILVPEITGGILSSKSPQVSEYRKIASLKIDKQTIVQLLSGMTNATAEEIFARTASGYMISEITDTFGDFALLNATIANYIPYVMVAVL